MNAADKEERQGHHRAIRNRIALIATERGLPESEIKKVMGRLSTRDVLRFARKHRVNMGTARNREGMSLPAAVPHA